MRTAVQEVRPTGHTQVKERNGGCYRHALWRDAAGRHQKVLGFAHVRDSGRRTPRGAVVWKAGPGPKPSGRHLTPAEAQDRLVRILADTPREKRAAVDYVTVNQEIDEWLRYVDVEKRRRATTVQRACDSSGNSSTTT